MDNEQAFDESQVAVLGLSAPCTASVIGGPGTGKTTLAQALAVQIMRENPQARVAVLSPDRRASSDLRNRISVDLGYLPGSLSVQSITAFAFAIVSAFAQFVGRREPELLSGPDQDALIKERFDLALEGDLPGVLPAQGEEGYPGEDAVRLPAYRAEFRDLMTRAAELELKPGDLAQMSKAYDEPIWAVGARMIEDYENALATQAGVGFHNPDIVDHARLLTQAATQLRLWDSVELDGTGRLEMTKPQWDWVIVDDIQNATLAIRSLLYALQDDGSSIVTFGDPDTAVQGFRGGIAQLPALLTKARGEGGIGAHRFYLGTRYRGGGEIGELVTKVTSGIHTAGVGKHRSVHVAENIGDTRVKALAFANENEEIAEVATRFRRLHLLEGVPYAQMAVVSRSTSAHESIRRSLLRHGVPVETIVHDQPLREQRAVAALIELIDIALADPASVDSDRIEALMTGVLIGIDPLVLRKLRRELRGWEMASGGRRTNAELLRDVLSADGVSSNIPEFARVSAILGSIRLAVREERLGEEVLWKAWEGVGVADQWRTQALTGGIEGDTADEDLDAVISLFRIAQRQADRDPASADIYALLDVLESQDLPEDSIARTGSGVDEIALVTPTSTVGRSWDYVAIVGVNDGVWPNTRLRNPLTKVPKLVNIVVGAEMAGRNIEPAQLVRDVIDDELRMLLQAVSRANKEVVLTCQEHEDIAPSRFIQWLFPDLQPAKITATTLDPAGLIGQLRQALYSADEHLRSTATHMLAELSAAGVAEADAANWADQLHWSVSDPVLEGASRLSPSRVESLLTCPLRAFLDRSNARSEETTVSLDIGTLIHTLAENHPHGPRVAIEKEYEELVETLEISDDLEGAKQRVRLRGMVKKLSDYLTAEDREVTVEQSAEQKITAADPQVEILVRARLDRLERIGETARIVDFKTSKQAISLVEAESNPQMRIYQWLVDEGAVPGVVESVGARLVYVGTDAKKYGVREQASLTPEQHEEAESMIRAADQAQRGPFFAAIPNTFCKMCSYRSSCPAQGTGRVFS